MEIEFQLTDHFYQKHNLGLNIGYKIEKVNANDLISKERIDLIAKLKYIEYMEKGYDLAFIKEIYTAHIKAFGDYNGSDSDNGNFIEKYFSTFDYLIDNIKRFGFDENKSVIPVGINNAIMDGSHLVAIAAYFNLDVPIIRFDNISVTYDTSFFKERLMDDEYIDFLVTEYCKIKKNIYFACIWPKAKGNLKREETDFLIKDSCEVVYKKKEKLNYKGLHNLMLQIYTTQDWIGSIENNFSGALNKVDACYDNNETLTIYVFECRNFDQVLMLKKKIRNVYKIGNHSIHITDTHSEVIQIANLILNQNSVAFLNNGKPNFYKLFNKKLNMFKKKLIDNKFSLDKFIIDSSSTLALHGLRDVKDIDFITISNGYEIIEEYYIDNHHDYVKYYGTSMENLVLNPNNYFVYNDLKFVTLDVLKRFKRNRYENKDQFDIKLIENMLKKKGKINLLVLKCKSLIKRKARNSKHFLKNKMFLILSKLGVYESFKSLYHYVFRN